MTTNICLCSSLHSFTFDLQRLERQKGTESTGNSAIMLNTHTHTHLRLVFAPSCLNIQKPQQAEERELI